MPAVRPSRTARGGAAEQAACDYLCARGYRILETNYQCRPGELDIIAEDERGVLCFIEVRSRTRAARDFGRPVETISRDKRRRIVRAAEQWILVRKIDAQRPMRFDVVGVVFDADSVTLELIRDAFQTN